MAVWILSNLHLKPHLQMCYFSCHVLLGFDSRHDRNPLVDFRLCREDCITIRMNSSLPQWTLVLLALDHCLPLLPHHILVSYRFISPVISFRRPSSLLMASFKLCDTALGMLASLYIIINQFFLWCIFYLLNRTRESCLLPLIHWSYLVECQFRFKISIQY